MADYKDPIKLAHPRKFYIGGEWVSPSSTATFDVLSCNTGEVCATVAEAHQDDMDRAVAAARKAFDAGPWPRMSHVERAGFMRKMAAAFERRSDEFAKIWTLESGILYARSCSAIGGWLNTAMTYYAGLADTYPFIESHNSGGLQAYLVREPVGVVGVIVPWNGPAGLMAYKCAPALLAGCTIILKSSPEAPCSGYLMAEICEEIGLPAGVVNVLTADRAVSETLVRNRDVDKITFTGSTAAGQKIAAICGERMARATFELGGKSPAIVLDDYDIGLAAECIAGGVGYLTGQVCHSLTRVIVSRSRHDEMVDAMAKVMHGLKIGDPFDPSSAVGPLATAAQLERVENYIRIGQAEGAQLAYGGGRPSHLNQGYYIEPTIFANVDNSWRIAQEEIFGPVICVIPSDSEDQSIAIANDTQFGLNSSVFTQDPDHAMRIARQIRAGTVGHNGSRRDFAIAFGGFKMSGIGREGGIEGLQPFVEAKTVVLETPYRSEA